MLVLDEALSAALLSTAAKESMVVHAIDPNALHADPTTARFLAKGQGERLRDQALWDLLLHHPAVVSPFDNLDVTKLRQEGLLSEQLSADSQSAAYKELSADPMAVHQVGQFVLADLAQAHSPEVVDVALDRFTELVQSDGFRVDNSLESALFGMFETYEAYVEGTRTMFGDASFSIPGKGGKRVVSGQELGASVATSAKREDFEAFKRYEPHRALIKDVGRSAQRWLGLVHAARTHHAVMSAAVQNSFIQQVALRNRTRRLNDAVTSGATHAAVQIWLEAVEWVPNLRTIADVLRLRDDRRIDRFRTAMAEWTVALSTGSAAEEQRLRSSIRTANRDLRKLRDVHKVSKFWTYASIPLDVLLAANPTLAPTVGGVPLGITGLVGFGLMEYADYKSGQLDWVMFGRD